jgi:hypothetical protein
VAGDVVPDGRRNDGDPGADFGEVPDAERRHRAASDDDDRGRKASRTAEERGHQRILYGG